MTKRYFTISASPGGSGEAVSFEPKYVRRCYYHEEKTDPEATSSPAPRLQVPKEGAAG